MTSEARVFHFKQFAVAQGKCAMKVGTDGVLLGAWCRVGPSVRSAIDIGTGTGTIALMLAQRHPGALITGVELEEEAASQAAENFGNSRWRERLRCYAGSIREFAEASSDQFDLVISNPPFFEAGRHLQASGKSRRMARDTTHLSPDSLLSLTSVLLSETGTFNLILPVSYSESLPAMAIEYGLYLSRKTLVHPRADKPSHRVLFEFQRNKSEWEEETLVIQASAKRNDFTAEYIALTRDFYTIL